jgi:signal peptidase I
VSEANTSAVLSEPLKGRHRGSKDKLSELIRTLRGIAVSMMLALLIATLIQTFLVRSFFIPSGSMESTLMINDRMLVNLLAPELSPLKRGDVIVFHDPDNWLGVNKDVGPKYSDPMAIALDSAGVDMNFASDYLTKRVIGLPGDTVVCCDDFGRLIVNGVSLTEPYTGIFFGAPASDLKFSVTVPKDSLWVMGDNRDNSADSRAHMDTATKGFVPISEVVGRAFFVTWPLNHLTWLSNPDADTGY